MGWETRSGNYYYYRKRRVGRRVVSEYVGRNEKAEIVAAQDALKRSEHQIAREAEAGFQAEAAVVDKLVAGFHSEVKATLQITLESAGFHQHKGQWRRKRAFSTRSSSRADLA